MASAEQQGPVEMQLALSKYSKRVLLKTILGRDDGGVGLIGQRVVIGAWVKSSREVRKDPVPAPDDVVPQVAGKKEQKDMSCTEVLQTRLPFFRTILKVLGGGDHRIREKLETIVPKPPQPSISILQVNDGSCVPSLQVSVESSVAPPVQVMPTGTCILVEGVLQQPSMPSKHVIELKAEKILHVGMVDQSKYPLTKKRLPLDRLRDYAHFRPRTTTVASVMRIRSALTQATHTFFENHGFLYVQVPIITSTDCEGSCEKFQVTTLFDKEKLKRGSATDGSTAGVSLEIIKASLKEKNKQVDELQRSESNKEALAAAIQDLKKTKELILQLEARERMKPGSSLETNKLSFSEDFFARQTYLTVSGRLHLESYACALGNVYSFGPRFRAEKVDSKKSLAEMWMVELEMAFSEIEDSMECADDFLKFVCQWLLDNCKEDLEFVSKRIDKTVEDRLRSVTSSSFAKVPYAEAVEILKQVTGKTFDTKIEWGVCLTEEHESYLADEIYKRPVIIYNHPKEVKPFFVRLNDDGRTVAAFDVVMPKVGVLIRGSQNEERLNVLVPRIRELGLEAQQYEWYLDIRRHGTAKHSGFSFAFDPMVLYATGLNDIRDVVPFPRSVGKANN